MPDGTLRRYWYPVATTDEVADRPLAARLLGERLALWRAGSRVVAFRDLCIHRGTPLSLGWLEGDIVVCAYHGWAYAADGACVRIPSLPPRGRIPGRARATAYRALERYGLVWVSLDTPAAPPPPFPEYDDPGYVTYWRTYEWRATAARMIESAVETDGRGLSYTVDTRGEAGGEVRRYRVILPFAVHLTKSDMDRDAARRRVLFFACCPLSESETRMYLGIARNFDLDQSDDAFERLSAVIAEQDRVIVESQRPDALPLDLGAERHLRGPDISSIEYRRALVELGIAP